MDTGTPTTYQEIMQSYGDYLIGTQQQPSKVNYFEGHGLSYTQMLLGVEMSAEAEHYNNSLHGPVAGPVADENKLYMITGRYFDGNAGTEEEQESCDQLQDNSVETDHMLHQDDTSNSYFDNNIPHNVDNSDGEWDDPPHKEYDIFGDGQPPNASTYQEPPNVTTVQDPTNACTAKQPGAYAVDSHAPTKETKEPVELLSQQDIEDFLDLENEKSCSQEVRRQHTPHLDMIFYSDEEAYNFYNKYASICGFSLKKAGNYHAKNQVVLGIHVLPFHATNQERLLNRILWRQERNEGRKGSKRGQELG